MVTIFTDDYNTISQNSYDIMLSSLQIHKESSLFKTDIIVRKKGYETRYESIFAHATYNISAGIIEGINNKIKSLRR